MEDTKDLFIHKNIFLDNLKYTDDINIQDQSNIESESNTISRNTKQNRFNTDWNSLQTNIESREIKRNFKKNI